MENSTQVSLTVNGEEKTFSKQLSLSELVVELGITNQRIAIARNGQVVPKAEHNEQLISNNDKIEIVRMVGGG